MFCYTFDLGVFLLSVVMSWQLVLVAESNPWMLMLLNT